MALTVFTAGDQVVGPYTIKHDKQIISISVQGDMTRGSVVTLERSWGAENSYRTVQTFTSYTERDLECKRGWVYRIRCSTFVTSDAPSAEIIP